MSTAIIDHSPSSGENGSPCRRTGLHGHPLDQNMVPSVVTEGIGSFVLVSATVFDRVLRPAPPRIPREAVRVEPRSHAA
jgi:hypothetical protein